MIANLAVATGVVAVAVLIHFWGLLALTALLDRHGERLRVHESSLRQASLILIVVCGVFALHTTQIWLYASVYRLLGEMRSFDEALYFSTVTFSTLGYGDVLLSPRWRLLGATEAANGLILIGWSTAFLISVTSRLKVLEHEWLERRPMAKP